MCTVDGTTQEYIRDCISVLKLALGRDFINISMSVILSRQGGRPNVQMSSSQHFWLENDLCPTPIFNTVHTLYAVHICK